MFVFHCAGALAALAGSTTANTLCESMLHYTIVHTKHHVNECNDVIYCMHSLLLQVHSGALRTGSVAFEATLWQNLDQLYAM